MDDVSRIIASLAQREALMRISSSLVEAMEGCEALERAQRYMDDHGESEELAFVFDVDLLMAARGALSAAIEAFTISWRGTGDEVVAGMDEIMDCILTDVRERATRPAVRED